jgi:hypothetical protein
MTAQDTLQRLHDLSESDADGLRSLAGEIASECRGAARTVLETWVNGPGDHEITCAFVCSELKELAVHEMLLRADSVEPARRVHLMEMVVDQQLAFRELTLTVLGPLLKDRSSAGPELRTCDAAYLLVRRIVPLNAAGAAQFSAESGFMALGEDQRDGEIGRWTESEAWKAIFPAP